MTFEVIYSDGNKKLFDSPNYEQLLCFLVENELHRNVYEIYKR